MNLVKKLDIKQGLEAESKTHPIIEKHLGIEMKQTENYHTFDYVNLEKKIYAELKARNNTSYKYPTTMIGLNKIEKGLELIKKGFEIYLYFKFLDGIFYYKMNSKTEEECKISIGGRCDRGRKEYKKYCFISINKLKKIS